MSGAGRVTVGLDIGGTKIVGAVVDEEGRIVQRGRRSTPAEATDLIVAAAADLIAELAADHEVVGVGAACAGFVDAAGERVMFAPNLPWRDEPLKDRLEGLSGLPVRLENDANAAAWGEFAHGSAADVEHMVFITVGTGVGGGVVIDGLLLRGAHGAGSEIGHVRVMKGGRLCGCGVHGCLEQYGSGTALLRNARELVASGDERGAALRERCGGEADRLTGRDIDEAAYAGDAAAVGLLADLGSWLGQGIASLCAVLDPQIVVLGGGVSRAGDLLLQPTQQAYRDNLTGRGFRPEAQFRLATLLDDAGMVGAAALARHL